VFSRATSLQTSPSLSRNSTSSLPTPHQAKNTYRKLRTNIQACIYDVASRRETFENKIQQLNTLLDTHLGADQEFRLQIFIVAIHELLCTSFLTEPQLYELTNVIFKQQKNLKQPPTLDLETDLLIDLHSPSIEFEHLLSKLNHFLSQNEPMMGFVKPNLSCQAFLALGILAFFAAYNGFTGGAESCSLFFATPGTSPTENQPTSLHYIVGFVSQAMVWWAFVSASVEIPKFSFQNSFKKNALLGLSCVHAMGQAVPSALYTYENETLTKLTYFPFSWLKKDSQNENISGKILVVSNFLLNAYFGLGQAQGTLNLYQNLVVRWNNAVTSSERAVLVYDLVAGFLKTMLILFIFMQPICDITQALNPTLEWFGKLLLALYLNLGEIKFYFSANVFWGIERYVKIACQHGPTVSLKLFFHQNINKENVIPALMSTMGSLCNMGNTKNTLMEILNLEEERNRNILSAFLFAQFIPGYIGNRATFG
jgi:hypothetical protein